MIKVDKKMNLCEEVTLQLYKENKEYYVDAEDLWNWLEIKTPFTMWIKRRIIQYKFEYNNDFKNYYYKINDNNFVNVKNIDEFNNSQQASRNGYSLKYFLKPDMAKQLAMVEDADKGKLVRQFYLDLEKYVYETNQRNQWLDWREKEAHSTHEFHSFIDDDRKCIGLCKELKAIVSYKYNLKYIYSKEMYFQEYLNKYNQDYWLYYVELRSEAERFVEAFKSLNNESYMHNVIAALQNNHIDNKDKFKEYKGKTKLMDKFPKQFGKPHIE